MSDPYSDRPFPRTAIIGAALLVGFALVSVAAVRISGIDITDRPASIAIESRDLRFEDRPDGAVAIYDTALRREIAVLAPGTNNFIRGTLRGFARERRQHEIGPEPAFRLTRWADGRLTLDDPATSRSVDLRAFGVTNVQSFALLLRAEAVR
jgi:putative photosynthetic complex assembly protein